MLKMRKVNAEKMQQSPICDLLGKMLWQAQPNVAVAAPPRPDAGA
jgi:hypothetical protein